MSPDYRPLILTAQFEHAVQMRFETLRRAHYPAEQNQVPAHLTLFHHLPGSEYDAVKRRLKAVCGPLPPPVAEVNALKSLGKGVTFRLHSPELEDVRAELAHGWASVLIPQDRAGFQPHVTVQNKVTLARARETMAALQRSFMPFTARVTGIVIWRYLGGPWEWLGDVQFRGR